MGLFGNLLKKQELVIGAPAAGQCVPIQEVKDPTFAEEMLGPGVAVKPESGRIVAPADGTVTTAFPTGHAVGMTTDTGIEVLVHVGLDTVTLNGEHFELKVKDGQKVKKGELLIEADLEAIAKAGFDTITPVIICNGDAYKGIEKHTGISVAEQDTIMTLSR